MGNHRIAGGRWRVDAPDFRCRDPCGESARRPLGSPAGHGPEHSGRRSTLVAPSARPHVPTSTTHGRTDSGLGLAWERHWDRESRGTRHTRSRRHRTEVRARGQSSESQRPERGARPLKPPTRRAPTRRRSGAVGAERVDVPTCQHVRGVLWGQGVHEKVSSNRHLTHQTWIILRQCRCGVGRIVGWRDSTRDRSGGRGATRERLQDSPLIY